MQKHLAFRMRYKKIPFLRPCPTHLYLKSYISKLWMWRMFLWCFLLCIQFLFSLTKTCLPTPRIPHLHQWQQWSSNFPSQKLGNYSGLIISSSCHFQSIHKIYWFHFHWLSCILLLLSLSMATTLTTASCLTLDYHLTMQGAPHFYYSPPPIYSIAAAKIRVLTPNKITSLFCFEVFRLCYLPEIIFVLFAWVGPSHLSDFRIKATSPKGPSLTILSKNRSLPPVLSLAYSFIV